ncbi:MAG: PaaI family thioesterase [Gammaproteobacteria bacterium]|nr:PaaI family thioesterase [Gammaproteobacteria bacterium]
MSEDHFARLRAMYLDAPCNDQYQPEISIQKGVAHVSVTVRPNMFHAGGSLHGSIFYRLLEDAALYATNSYVNDVIMQAASFTCYMVKPVTHGVITAEGKVKNTTAELYIAEAQIMSASGDTVARGSGAFLKSKIRLVPEIGYKI